MPTYRIWSEPDGTVKVTTFLDEPRRAIATLLREGHVSPLATFVDHADVSGKFPLTGKRFRSAWRLIGDRIEVSLPLARSQRLAELRVERNVRLTDSDGKMLRAQELGQDTTAWKAYRQALRDLPMSAQLELQSCSNDTTIADWIPQWPTEPAPA